jgi:uncharacterized protein
VVKVQQQVRVTVLEVDLERNRIGLSMRSGQKPAPARPTGKPPSGPRPKTKGGKSAARSKQPFHNPMADALAKLQRS